MALRNEMSDAKENQLIQFMRASLTQFKPDASQDLLEEHAKLLEIACDYFSDKKLPLEYRELAFHLSQSYHEKHQHELAEKYFSFVYQQLDTADMPAEELENIVNWMNEKAKATEKDPFYLYQLAVINYYVGLLFKSGKDEDKVITHLKNAYSNLLVLFTGNIEPPNATFQYLIYCAADLVEYCLANNQGDMVYSLLKNFNKEILKTLQPEHVPTEHVEIRSDIAYLFSKLAGSTNNREKKLAFYEKSLSFKFSAKLIVKAASIEIELGDYEAANSRLSGFIDNQNSFLYENEQPKLIADFYYTFSQSLVGLELIDDAIQELEQVLSRYDTEKNKQSASLTAVGLALCYYKQNNQTKGDDLLQQSKYKENGILNSSLISWLALTALSSEQAQQSASLIQFVNYARSSQSTIQFFSTGDSGDNNASTKRKSDYDSFVPRKFGK